MQTYNIFRPRIQYSEPICQINCYKNSSRGRIRFPSQQSTTLKALVPYSDHRSCNIRDASHYKYCLRYLHLLILEFNHSDIALLYNTYDAFVFDTLIDSA